MSKFIMRLLLFCIFFPLLYVLVFLLPYLNYLALTCLIVFFSLVGTFETENIMRQKFGPGSRIVLPVAGGLLPLICYLDLFFPSLNGLLEISFIGMIIFAFFRVIILNRGKDIPNILNQLVSSLVVILYPGYLLTFLIRLLFMDQGNWIFLFLLGLVFFNDIAAYLFGRLFGRSTQLNWAISPNKSAVGFISGFVMSLIISVFFYYFKPDLFSKNLVFVILFSALIGIIAIIGDLVESGMKRSAGIKDSGTIMLGRGGILDSIDSLLFCCPVFFYIYPLLA
ncbi:MAG: phosphatidate cytidylyltransferase [Spirochaetales bacterium]|nr:phosphatidate cytidylyltransferase [Spirochaetales bacterium]